MCVAFVLFDGSSSREMRNRAEKQRRDKFNSYISEMGSLVSVVASAPRKLDKTSTLRLCANFIRIHQSEHKSAPLLALVVLHSANTLSVYLSFFFFFSPFPPPSLSLSLSVSLSISLSISLSACPIAWPVYFSFLLKCNLLLCRAGENVCLKWCLILDRWNEVKVGASCRAVS